MTSSWPPAGGQPPVGSSAQRPAAAWRRGWCLVGPGCGLALEILGVEEEVEPDPGDAGGGDVQQTDIAVSEFGDVGAKTNGHGPERDPGVDDYQGDYQAKDQRDEPHHGASEVQRHIFFSG